MFTKPDKGFPESKDSWSCFAEWSINRTAKNWIASLITSIFWTSCPKIFLGFKYSLTFDKYVRKLKKNQEIENAGYWTESPSFFLFSNAFFQFN